MCVRDDNSVAEERYECRGIESGADAFGRCAIGEYGDYAV